MANVSIPIEPSVPHQTMSIPLEGVAYGLEVRWNERSAGWYMSLFDQQGDAIMHGMRIVLGALPGKRIADDRFPPGIFFAADTAGNHQDAGIDDLGARVQLYYQESE